MLLTITEYIYHDRLNNIVSCHKKKKKKIPERIRNLDLGNVDTLLVNILLRVLLMKGEKN